MRSTPSTDRLAIDPPATEGVVNIREISAAQLQELGMAQLAYVKPVLVDGNAAFAIHAADGTPMALAGDRELAFAAIRQHEMMPALVH